MYFHSNAFRSTRSPLCKNFDWVLKQVIKKNSEYALHIQQNPANACLILFIHQCQYSFRYFQIHHWSPIFKILERVLIINIHIQWIFCKDISKIVYSSMSIFAAKCFESTIKPSDKKSIMLLFMKYHSFWFFPLKFSIKINSSWNFNSLEQVQ